MFLLKNNGTGQKVQTWVSNFTKFKTLWGRCTPVHSDYLGKRTGRKNTKQIA